MSLLVCLGAAAGVALCWPIPWEAAGWNNRSIYPSLQHPPPDPQLHKSGHGRQSNATYSSAIILVSHKWFLAFILCEQMCSLFMQAMKVVGIKAHTENDKGQVLLDLYIRWMLIHSSFDLRVTIISVLQLLQLCIYDVFALISSAMLAM